MEALTKVNNGSKARSPHRCLTAVCHSDFMLKMKVRGGLYTLYSFSTDGHFYDYLPERAAGFELLLDCFR